MSHNAEASLFHASLAELDAGLARLAPAPREEGRVRLIVRRIGEGRRETPARVRLTLEGGVEGDEWARRLPRDPRAQVAVIRHDVATLIAGGQPLTVFGDNLFVDLDIAAAHGAAGCQLQVGEALLEVTDKPHTGCLKFRRRFGGDALDFVARPASRHLNLRGTYWRVIEPGEVAVGSAIQVLRPGTARAAAC